MRACRIFLGDGKAAAGWLVNQRTARFGVKKTCAAFALFLILAQTLITPYVWAIDALPQGGQVVVGAAEIVQPTTSHLQVTTQTDRTAIDWQSFDIGTQNSVTITQPNANALTLNRVKNGQPTKIFGKLDSNGRVVVANPAGVWFGPDSHVDVAGLVAAAADIDPASVSSAEMMATASDATAGVLADGAIVVSSNSGAALVGRSVEQRGVVTAPGGQVTLAAADSFSINLRADGRLEVQTTKVATATAPLPDGRTAVAAVSQQGKIDAGSGRVSLQSAVANAALDEAINIGGQVVASKAVVVGDVIELRSSDDGVVRVQGTLLADASKPNSNGGKVRVFGKQIDVTETATVTARATGSGKGGSILIGGDYQGQKTPEAPAKNAELTYVAKGAKLDASAGGRGDGGEVIVWADDATLYAGDAKAEGGSEFGNGGLIEVSGAKTLGFYGTASVAAPNGTQGRILLDPRDITIAATGADDASIATFSLFANPNTTTDVFFSAAAVQALTGAVEIQASRNINVNAALNFSNVATTSVNFRAGQAITTTAAIQATGGASLSFNANDPGSTTRLATANISLGANLGGATTGAITFSNNGGTGTVVLTANQTWQTNNAAINLGGMTVTADVGNNNRALTANAGTGTVTFGAIGTGVVVPGNVSITGGVVTVGAVLTGATTLTRAGGSLTINATTGLATAGNISTVGGVSGAGLAGGAVNITGVGVTVGTISTAGTAGAAGNNNGGAGGAVTIAAGTGALTSTTYSTIGGAATGNGTGGAGGAVNISAGAARTATTITTTGGATVTGTAGNGGNITVSGTAVSVGTLTASGGAATGAGVARNGGNINLTGTTSLTATGNIVATGGNTAGVGGTNGNGGNIAANNNFLMNQNANTNVSNNGGTFVGVANGVGGTQTYSANFTFTPGAANRTLTLNAGSGAVNFNGTSITVNNNAGFDLQADAYTLTTGANSLTTGGAIALRPGQDVTTIGIGVGAPGTWQFAAAQELAINPTATTVTIGRGSGTGLITFTGVMNFSGDNVVVQSGGSGGSILFSSTANVSLTGTNQSFTLVSGGAGGSNITFNAGAALTNNSGATSSVAFSTNNLTLLGATGAISGNGSVIFQGATAATTVGYGGGAGTAQYTQAYLDAVASFVTAVIGNAAGTAAVNVAGSLTQSRSVIIRSSGNGGTVNLNPTAAISLTGGTARNLTIATGGNAGDALTIQNGATISNTTGATGQVIFQTNVLTSAAAANAISGNGTLTVQTVGNANTMGIGTGAGSLALTQTVLNQFSGFVSQSFGRGHTIAVNINGPITLARSTNITSNGANGSISFGATANMNVTGTNQFLSLNTGSGTTYGGNINSLVVTAGARITNNTGGATTLSVNNIVNGDANAIAGTGTLTIQPQAAGVTVGIGAGTGAQAVYDQNDLNMFTGYSAMTLGRALTVGLTVGGTVVLPHNTTILASGVDGYIRFLNTANVSMTGVNRQLTLTSGSGTAYTGAPNQINTVRFEAGAQLTNNTGAGSAIILNTNNLATDPTSSVTGDGVLTIQQLANNIVVGVGSGSNTVQYLSAELDRFFNFASMNIGLTTSTVALNIDGAISLPRNTTFRAGGSSGAVNLGATAAITMSGTDVALTLLSGNAIVGTVAQNVVTLATGATITNNTGAGSSVFLNTNKLVINTGASIVGDGTFTVASNVAQSLGLGTAAAGLSISNAELATISGFVTQIFGSNTATGAITLDGTVNLDRNTSLRAGGAGGTVTNVATAVITVAGASTLDILTGSAAANTFTHTNGAVLTMGSGNLGIQANTIALAGANSITGTGALTIESVGTGNTMGFGGGGGQLSLTAAHMGVFGGFASQTFGRTDGAGAINMNATTFVRTTTIRGDTSTLDTAGAIAVTGAGNDLTFSTNGLISLANNITTVGGDVTLDNGLVRLIGNVAINSTNGNVVIEQTVNSDATTRNFTVNAGTGSITLSGALGNTAALGAVALTAGGSLALPAITTTGAGGNLGVTLTAGNLTQTGVATVTGTTTVAANTVANQAVTLTQNNLLTGAVAVTTNATTGGNVDLRNAIATGTTIGTSAAGGNFTLVNTQGNVSQTASTTLAAGGSLIITAPAGTFLQGAGASFSATDFALSANTAPTFTTLNDVDFIAASLTSGAFNYTQANALTVSSVGALTGITAGTVSLRTTGATGDITLDDDIVASGAGNAIVVASGAGFTNNAGADALQPGTGRYLIYSSQPGSPNTVLGGLTPATKRYNRTFAGYGPGSVTETGNVILYSVAPTLTITADGISRAYGDANPALTFSISNTFIDGDTASILTGAPTLTTTATQFSPVSGSPYTITTAAGTLANTLGYALVYADGSLTVTQRPLSITVDPSSKQYGDVNPTFTASYSGFAPTESASNLTGTLSFSTAAGQFSAVSGSPYTVTASGQTSGNYNITYNSGLLTVTQRPLSITVDPSTRTAGTVNPAFTASYNGFVTGESQVNLTGVLSFNTPATIASPAGTYLVTASGQTSTNYLISFIDGNLVVTAAAGGGGGSTINATASGQNIIPSFIYTRQPTRIIEIAERYSLGLAIEQGNTIGRTPTGIILPFARENEWDDVVPQGGADVDVQRSPNQVVY